VALPPRQGPPAKKGLSGNALLGIGVAVCAAVIVIAVVSLRFLQKPPPPPPPPPPPAPEQNVGRILRFSPEYYKAVLEEDAKRYKTPAIDVATMSQPLPYASELSQPRLLKIEKDAFETPHLRVSSRVIKEWARTPSGQGFKFEHIVLSITNRSDRPVAYRVATTVSHPERCRSQGAIEHNAIALGPGETVERTECLWHKNERLRVDAVEAMELTPLGYYYVSRLNPVQIMLDARTAAGHRVPPPAKECAFVPWRDIKTSAEQAHTGWGDVIDFYARHNCDEYSFFRGYTRWTAAGTLPAKATGGAAAAANAPAAAAPSGERVDQPPTSK
jgi:hypothetical protein